MRETIGEMFLFHDKRAERKAQFFSVSEFFDASGKFSNPAEWIVVSVAKDLIPKIDAWYQNNEVLCENEF